MTARHLALVALLAWLSACGSDASNQEVHLDDLSFDVPAGWQRAEDQQNGIETAVWSPGENEKKESIAIIRTTNAPPLNGLADADIKALLVDSQPVGAQPPNSKLIATKRGLHGARVTLDYVPPGLSRSYHRVHVVLVGSDGVLIHVLYTALRADPSESALGLVLSTIAQES